jgi:hypothetical protein
MNSRHQLTAFSKLVHKARMKQTLVIGSIIVLFIIMMMMMMTLDDGRDIPQEKNHKI